jgi:5'-nucleotidase
VAQPRLVTQAGFYGKALTDIRLTFGADGDIDWAASTATNVPVRQTAPDAAIQDIVSYWEGRAAAEGSVSVGSQSADLDRAYRAGTAVRDAESGLGNLVADAQLAYARATPSLGGADVDVAFMNPGGLRADINCLSSGAADPDGNVTFAETFSVQPFSNTVNTVDLTGAGIEQVLEQQWATRSGSNAMLHLSVAGLTYEFDARRPVGDRVDPASVRIGGQPLNLTDTYQVAANSFLIAGGDSFAAFVSGRPAGATAVTGGNDVDAFNAYVLANSPVSPPALDRAISLDPANSWDDDGSGAGPCTPGAPTPPSTPTPSPTPAPAPAPGGGAAGPGAPGAVLPVVGGVGGSTDGGSQNAALAYTGSPVTTMLTLGGLLTVAGVVLTAAGYRRRRGLAD